MLQLFSSNRKNSKLFFYLKSALRFITPRFIFRRRLNKTLRNIEKRKDYEYILKRVNYYNKLSHVVPLSEFRTTLSKFSLKGLSSAYFFDTLEYIRWFDKSLGLNYLFGDIIKVPDVPAILKSRPIKGNNENSILFKLNKVRHFIFLNDRIPFSKKMNKSTFRGKIDHKHHRIKFVEMYFNHPLCDAYAVESSSDLPHEWVTKPISIKEHLNYKFIVALEGNDVASNLKWVMSSNSIAVMPQPTYETWFMEGTLIPNYHYIEIKADYSDLEEKLSYYIEHPEEAEKIICNAHEYVAQFKNKKRERLISLLVLNKYFKMTGQLKDK